MGPTGESFGTTVEEEELTCSNSDGLEGRGEPDIEERGGGCTCEEVSVVMWECPPAGIEPVTLAMPAVAGSEEDQKDQSRVTLGRALLPRRASSWVVWLSRLVP